MTIAALDSAKAASSEPGRTKKPRAAQADDAISPRLSQNEAVWAALTDLNWNIAGRRPVPTDLTEEEYKAILGWPPARAALNAYYARLEPGRQWWLDADPEIFSVLGQSEQRLSFFLRMAGIVCYGHDLSKELEGKVVRLACAPISGTRLQAAITAHKLTPIPPLPPELTNANRSLPLRTRIRACGGYCLGRALAPAPPIVAEWLQAKGLAAVATAIARPASEQSGEIDLAARRIVRVALGICRWNVS